MALITKDLNTPALTAQQLAQFIVGDTGTVVPGTAKFTGDNRAAGTFGGGISEGINVEAGVIFSTGEIENANGPNNSDSKSSSLASLGDTVTLDPLVAPNTTKNAAVLEFEFIAKQSQFSLEYVFASEEYNEFVNQFNDVFAFVLNGVNIPLIPGTNQPVSINTINNNKNSAFYIDNDPTTYGLGKTPHNTQFDGFTKLLTAQGTVIPNITNKLKIAIADTRDDAYDSAIFLNVPPSFNFSQPTYQVKEDGKVIGAAVTINRTGITNGTSKIDVKLSNGSATGGATLGLGVDFVFTTQTVNFAPNQTTAEVIVPINDDSLVEPTENLTLTLTNPASARIGITQNTATLNITDNDTTGITITSSGGNTAVTESGTTDTYTAVLNSQPASLVILTVKPDKQTDLGSGGGNPIALNFTPANWNVPQTVTVKAVDDDITEASPHTSTILHTASSADPNYDGSTPPIRVDGTAIATLTANITDNDTALVKITETGGSTKIGEGGATDNYTAVLTSQPAADVTVTASPDAQSDVGTGGGSPIALKFTPSNWNVPQLVTVQAVDDAVAQGTHSSTIAHKVTSIDAKYNLIATPSVIAQITDNDTAGVTITPPNTTATEGGATGSYKVALTSKPTAPVKVNFNSGIQIESISTFTFTSDNWNLPQTVTVKATDDSLVEGLHTGTINHSIAVGSATEYLPVAIAPVTVSITDNDVANPSTPSVTIAPASTNATEGGATGSYKVSLNTKPTANVTVNVAVGSQINAIAPIVFTPVNWNAPQTVTVTATDDTVVEGAHTGTINHSVAAGSAAEYLPVAIAPVTVSITDNDIAASTAGVKISPTNTSAAEGGANGSYSAVLTSQPSSEVKVSFTTDSQIEAIASFTFTSANWNLPQTATVKAVDDSAVEGTHLSTIASSASSTDLAYNNIGIPKVDVLILDNDIPGIAVTPTSTNAAEGGATGSYSVVLTKAPTANVTVNFAAGSQIDAIAPIVFTPANWNAAQTVTVKATDDSIVEGTHTGLIFSSVAPGSAAEYLPVAIAPVTVTIADNDITPPTPTPVINFSPTIIVPTPTPVINFSPTIIVSAPTPEPTPGPVPTPPPTPAPVPTPPPTPTPTPLSPPLTPTPQPNADPDCICAQITLPDISPLHGFNPVDNNLVGGDRNETLSGGSGGDGINGLSGDDVLVGLAGNDNLFGGFISNIPVGPSVDRDLLLGGPGDDYLNGQAGYDTLFGGEGNDAAFGGKDNDLIWGGRGSDTLVGEEGNDSLYGGTNSESDRDRTGNDLLFGAKGNDYLSGQDASDSISGGDGSDTARGGKGNDVILGDSGSDSLLGDQGNDSICGGDGDDTVYGDIGSPLPVGVAGGQDQVCGGAGNDLLFGNEGSDTINGDAGNDTILGGKDSDSLVGGAGDDVLIGDEGSDTLVGGSGRDLFVLTSAQGSDTISDFRKGEDLLSLAGGLTFTQLSISQSTDGRDASPATFIRISNSGELIAVLNGVQASAIAQSDFVQLLRLGI